MHYMKGSYSEPHSIGLELELKAESLNVISRVRVYAAIVHTSFGDLHLLRLVRIATRIETGDRVQDPHHYTWGKLLFPNP